MKVETINLPKERVAQFKSNLSLLEENDKPLSKWVSYTVQPGEKPQRIADKFNMSISQLQEANGVSLKSLSKPGQPLLVLTEGNNELPKGAAPLVEMNENTPVTVPEADKPSKKSSRDKPLKSQSTRSKQLSAKTGSTKTSKTPAKSGSSAKSSAPAPSKAPAKTTQTKKSSSPQSSNKKRDK